MVSGAPRQCGVRAGSLREAGREPPQGGGGGDHQRALASLHASLSHKSLLNSAPGVSGAPSLIHLGLLGLPPSLFSFSGPSAVISTNKSDHGYFDVCVTPTLARLCPVSVPS